MALGAIGAGICAWALFEITSAPSEGVAPGWGLYVSLAGCVMLFGASWALGRDSTYY